MLDEICTLIFLGEDMPGRVQWYYKAGWRELREEYDRHVERYAGKPGWDPWLEEFRESLKTVQVQAGITAAEIADPASVRWWPTLSKMIRAKMLGAEAQAFLQYMSDWFYREFSQEDHLSLPGLIRRGSAFLRRPDNPLTEAILRKPDDPAMENTWKKLRSDWVTDALVLYLAFLTEIILLCGFDLRSRCAYLWGVIKEYSPMAAEVYEVRYETKLKS